MTEPTAFVRAVVDSATAVLPEPKPGKRCPAKVVYRTRRRALQAQATALKSGKHLRAYKCSICREWHLTSRPVNP